MTTRAQAEEETRGRHRFRALVLTIISVALIAVHAIFIVLQATHMPHVVASDTGVTGDYYETLEIDWDHLVVEHTADLDKGNVIWEVTRDPGNETLRDGTHEKNDDRLISVPDVGPGTYGVYLEPTGVNAGIAYDVTVREFYLAPATIKMLKWVALLFLAVLALALYYVRWAKQTEKYREEYRLATTAVVLTMVLSAAVGLVPWS